MQRFIPRFRLGGFWLRVLKYLGMALAAVLLVGNGSVQAGGVQADSAYTSGNGNGREPAPEDEDEVIEGEFREA